jgi:hypothetical protein
MADLQLAIRDNVVRNHVIRGAVGVLDHFKETWEDPSEEDMKVILEPTMDGIKKEAEIAIRKNLDEERGRAEQEKMDNKKDDMIASRVANISDLSKLLIYNENGDYIGESTSSYVVEKLQRGYRLGYPEIKRFVFTKAVDEDIPYDEGILDYPTDDDEWDDYIPHSEVWLDEPFCKVIDIRPEEMMEEFASKYCYGKDILVAMRRLKDMDISSANYCLDRLIKMGEIMLSKPKKSRKRKRLSDDS